MSYEELDSIKEQGVGAIVNLCGEFSDLHEIEEQAGFEVYFLPTPDECAPEMDEMKAALEWLDEALYLKKKVLIHCRHGHGRTGTFVSAYFLRRGMALKYTEKALKGTRANPTNYSQWKLLKKYSKQQGQLNAREATIDLERALGITAQKEYQCPLFEDGSCLICANRPLRCRNITDSEQRDRLQDMTTKLSRDIFLALTEVAPSDDTIHFSIIDTVSGRFVQQYFQIARDKS